MSKIIDKNTKFYLREDLVFDPNTEAILYVEPKNGLFKPKWTGEIIEDEDGNLTVSQDGEWIEGATPEEIAELTKPQPHEPSVKERIDDLENTILMLLMM